MATLEFHKGTQANQGHNRRDENAIVNQEHIRADGVHESWADEPKEQAYERLFEEAKEEFNNRNQSKHPERVIKESYYTHICNTEKQNPVYEIIVGIKPGENEQIDPDLQRQVLHDYIEGWKQVNTAENGRLELIGVYFHNDEEGIPHLHVDYIPVVCSNRGMRVKTSQEGALRALGFVSTGMSGKSHSTALVKWEDSERKRLKEIAKGYGIEIMSAHDGQRKHFDKETYVAREEACKAKQKVQEVKAEYEEMSRKLVELGDTIELAESEKANAETEKAKSERAAEEAKKVQLEAEKQRDDALESLDATVAIAQIESKKRVRLSREEQEKLAKNAIAVEQLEARERAVADEKRSIEAQKAELETEKNRLRELRDKVSEKASELKKMLAETLGKHSLRRLIASLCIDFVVEVFDFFTREIANEYVSDDKKDTYDEQCRETKKQIRGMVADKLRIPESALLDTADIDAELAKLRTDDPADRSKNRFESAYDHDDRDDHDDYNDRNIEC